ncbi:hypothetical protein GN956_G2384 [Arapaima gigas]
MWSCRWLKMPRMLSRAIVTSSLCVAIDILNMAYKSKCWSHFQYSSQRLASVHTGAPCPPTAHQHLPGYHAQPPTPHHPDGRALLRPAKMEVSVPNCLLLRLC